MTEIESRRLALELMQLHGLLARGWTYKIDKRATRRGGQCRYNQRQIGVSAWMIKYNDEARVRNTILHEIAHALCPPWEGHGKLWKAKAREIGCDGVRCYNGRHSHLPPAIRPPLAWLGTCPKGHEHHRSRRPQNIHSCGVCDPRVFRPEAVITWRRRGETDPVAKPTEP